MAGLLVLWLLIIIYMSNTVFPSTGEANPRAERQLQRALEELQKLRMQNQELHVLANELKDIKLNAGSVKPDNSDVDKLQKRLDKATNELKKLSENSQKSNNSRNPSLDHEVARRRVEYDVREFWFYIRAELNAIKELAKDKSLVKPINTVLQNGASYQKSLKNDLFHLSDEVDGMGDWRLKESLELGKLVQNRIRYLQNPKDCGEARKMVCNLSKGCGYGCQLHHVTYCLMLAYSTERTLILESKGWRYSSDGWEKVFQPLSNTCTDRSGKSSKHWGPEESIKNVQVVEMPIVDSLHPRPLALPLAIPEDLADRLIRLHGDPAVWWIGQFVTYLTRPQQHLAEDLAQTKSKLGFSNPVVGVHVRRTDKVGLEAAYHGIEEYMLYVDEWFDTYEQRHPGIRRKVYLASDDPTVLSDAKKLYPHYEFISDNEISKTAGLGSRYTDASLRGVIIDIHFMSLCDYLVCTFSSQVCRVAYELMQPMRGDASNWFKSLDDVYYFGGQNGHNMEVVEAHVAQNDKEIDLQPGDLVGIAGNHWNGYSKGRNQRNGKSGLYPSYKVKDKIVRVSLPTYPLAKKL